MGEVSRPSESWGAWDIESEDWVRFRVGVVVAGDVTIIAWTPRQLVDGLDSLTSRTGRRWTLWAHFGGRFDIKFVLPELTRRHKCEFNVVNTSLARVTVRARNADGSAGEVLYVLQDSHHVLPSGLRQLAQEFGTTRKMSVDRTRIEDLSDAEVSAYCESDCRVLLEVLHRALAEFGLQNFRLTIASQSKQEWVNGFRVPGERSKTPARMQGLFAPGDRQAFYRAAYYGGRVEVFRRHAHELRLYDVRSMFPKMMRDRDYPQGRTAWTSVYDETRLGIYRVRVEAPPDIKLPLLPFRDPEGRGLVFPVGTWTASYCTPELALARKLGYRIEVLEGVVWAGRSRPFADYIDKWFRVKEESKRAGNLGKSYIAKLYLNTLYGKLGERDEHVEVIHEPSAEEVAKGGVGDLFPELGLYTKRVVKEQDWVLTHLAAFVTSYARVHLYELMSQTEPLYCDTDSIATCGELPTGKNLGDLELQEEMSEAFFLAPKLYAFRPKKGGPGKVKSKGMVGSQLAIEQFERALRGDLSGFSTQKSGIMGLREASKRKLSNGERLVLQKRELVRSFKGGFNKRALDEDGIRTLPLECPLPPLHAPALDSRSLAARWAEELDEDIIDWRAKGADVDRETYLKNEMESWRD